MATNFVKARYSEIIDINTRAGEMTIIGIHAPNTSSPISKLGGFYSQYRKFKYNGCTLTMAPAAQLPMDPLGVGFEAGENQVDPRDLMNPILFHGTYGDTFGYAFDNAFTTTADFVSPTLNRTDMDFENTTLGSVAVTNYYAALADPSWRKFGVMSPIRLRGLHPRVNNMVTITPVPPIAGNTEIVGSRDNVVTSQSSNIQDGSNQIGLSMIYGLQGQTKDPDTNGSLPVNQQVFTNGTRRLGWLDTYSRIQCGDNPNGSEVTLPKQTYLPKAFMGILILPPAYSVKMCYRMVIHHYFSFRDFTAGNRTGFYWSRGAEPEGGYFNNLDDSVTATSLSEPASIDSNAELELVGTTVS